VTQTTAQFLLERRPLDSDSVLLAAVVSSASGALAFLLISAIGTGHPEIIMAAPLVIFFGWWLPLIGVLVASPVIALLAAMKRLTGLAMIVIGVILPVIWRYVSDGNLPSGQTFAFPAVGAIMAAIFWVIAAQKPETGE
jgi:hypothetical protein